MQSGGGDSVGAVAGLAKDFVIVHNEIQTLRKEVIGMKKELSSLSTVQSEHLAALQSGKRSNSMVRFCWTLLFNCLYRADGVPSCGLRNALQSLWPSSLRLQASWCQCGMRGSRLHLRQHNACLAASVRRWQSTIFSKKMYIWFNLNRSSAAKDLAIRRDYQMLTQLPPSI